MSTENQEVIQEVVQEVVQEDVQEVPEIAIDSNTLRARNKESVLKYKERNREILREKSKEYYQKNKEKILARVKENQKKKKEEIVTDDELIEIEPPVKIINTVVKKKKDVLKIRKKKEAVKVENVKPVRKKKDTGVNVRIEKEKGEIIIET